MKFQFTKEEIQAAFQRLEKLLPTHQLLTEEGTLRTGKAEEFMLMHQDEENRLYFKHRDSRNYLVLLPEDVIHVPTTKEPFHRGTFNVCD